MERAEVLKWRLLEKQAYQEQYSREALNREAARIIRPLLSQYLPAWACFISGEAVIHPAEGIPTQRIVCDRESAVFTIPIRDYLSTKVFHLNQLHGTFVILIEHEHMSLQFITTHFRIRNRYTGTTEQGFWLPPGAYTQTYCIQNVDFKDTTYTDAVKELLPYAEDQRSFIRNASAAARHSQCVYMFYKSMRRIIGWLLYIVYLACIIWILIWFALVLFS